MTNSTPALPGRLGDPSLTLATDPRLDPRLAKMLGDVDEAQGDPPVEADAPLEEILQVVGALESQMSAVYAAQAERARPIAGVARRTEVIKGAKYLKTLFLNTAAKECSVGNVPSGGHPHRTRHRIS